MTKDEAIQAMQNGEKVRHTYFSDGEFIYMKHQKLYDERDLELPDLIFWKTRKDKFWETGWEVWKEKTTKEYKMILPTDKQVAKWFEDNIGIQNDCSASSAIYKFRLWLKESNNSEAERNKEDAIGFGKFLKHLDNGTTHYNPETKETTGSIGFSPFDCFMDETMTVEQLYTEYELFKSKK